MSIVGEVIGNYRILERIGSGGMGQVFRGQEVLLERDVAIKALHPELTANPEVLERFQLEARTLSRLNHPNIVLLYNFFQHADRYYMVMEFAKGLTLAELMKRCPQGMPWKLCIQLMSQILSALEYAHGMGVIHRDIKPANIMIRDNRAVKVMDFGVARILGSTKLTRTGFMAGTLKYMSPEQIRCKEVDARCDQYSTALVLYEMLCGHPPFDEPSEYDVIRAQVEDEPVSLLEKIPDLPPRLDALVKRGLAKTPQDRFASAWEFKQLLEGVAAENMSDEERQRIFRNTISAPPPLGFADRTPPASSLQDRAPLFGEDEGSSTKRRDPSVLGGAPAPSLRPQTLRSQIQPPVTATAPTLPQGHGKTDRPPSRTGLYVGLGVAGLAVAALAGFAVHLLSVDKADKLPPLGKLAASVKEERRQAPPPAPVPEAADETEAKRDIQRMRDEIDALKKTVEDSQNQLHKQALEAARNTRHFDELLAAAPSEDRRLAFQASKYEAEYQFNLLTEVETQYMAILQEQQGPNGADAILRSAAVALDTGNIDKAKQGFTQALKAWKRLSEYPTHARQIQVEGENKLFGQMAGLWGINNCNSPSLWEILDRHLRVTWPKQPPAEERILAIRDNYIYTVVETQQARYDIYRYHPDAETLKVENVTDGRSKILKKCQP